MRSDQCTLTSSAPPGDIDDGYAPHAPRGSEFMTQERFLNSSDMTDAFLPTQAFGTWNTPHRSHEAQEYVPPVTPFSTASALPELGFENAFYTHDFHDQGYNKGTKRRLTYHATELQQEDVKPSIDTAAPVQDRVRYIMDQAATVGFNTIDDVLAAYYTEKFDETSLLCQDQRLNRNRRLPQLLSTLHNAAKRWSPWERRGFQEQITLGAEEILIAELNSFTARYPSDTAGQETLVKNLGGEQLGSRRDPRVWRNVQDNVTISSYAFLSHPPQLQTNCWP